MFLSLKFLSWDSVSRKIQGFKFALIFWTKELIDPTAVTSLLLPWYTTVNDKNSGMRCWGISPQRSTWGIDDRTWFVHCVKRDYTENSTKPIWWDIRGSGHRPVCLLKSTEPLDHLTQAPGFATCITLRIVPSDILRPHVEYKESATKRKGRCWEKKSLHLFYCLFSLDSSPTGTASVFNVRLFNSRAMAMLSYFLKVTAAKLIFRLNKVP